MSTLWMGYLLGLTQGVRHALEPDHLAAVSTVVAEQRSARASVAYAACWGLGHALVLLALGGALFVLRRRLPPPVESSFELGVAVMLVALGIRALRRAFGPRTGGSPGPRRHGPGLPRPLLIGVAHGLAGSGALTAIVASTYPSAAGGLFFMALYGLGASAGMALLAGIAGVPLARAMRTRRGPSLLLGITGAVSLVVGLAWGWPIVSAWTQAASAPERAGSPGLPAPPRAEDAARTWTLPPGPSGPTPAPRTPRSRA
jgi:hypothetical protein